MPVSRGSSLKVVSIAAIASLGLLEKRRTTPTSQCAVARFGHSARAHSASARDPLRSPRRNSALLRQEWASELAESSATAWRAKRSLERVASLVAREEFLT